MKTRIVMWATAATLAACGGEQTPSSAQPVGGLQCPAGQVGYTFGAKSDDSSSEGRNQAGPDASIPETVSGRPNRIVIKNATCDGNLDWTSLFQDACDGRIGCDYQSKECLAGRGTIHVEYACSDDPNRVFANDCAGPNSDRCLFSLKCEPSALAVFFNSALFADAGTPNTTCVPAECNAFERRDKQMRCVFDDTKPEEASIITSARFSSGQFPQPGMNVFGRKSIDSDLKLVYPAVSKRTESDGRLVMDLDTRRIAYFEGVPPSVGVPQVAREVDFRTVTENQLTAYRVLLANAKYRLKTKVYYVVRDGKPNVGMKGVVTIWVYDEYGTNPVKERGFRCVAHSIDMSKYGPGTALGTDAAGRQTFAVSVDEEFILPRDCAEASASQLETEGVLAKRNGMQTLQFLQTYPRRKSFLKASYDLEGRVARTSGNPDTDCSPNPIGFFFDSVAGAPDRYAYYSQRHAQLNFSFGPEGGDSVYALTKLKVEANEVHIREANYTTLGVSGVRPKKLSYKINTVGDARGNLRVDADWYLNGDRHKFWGKVALRNPNYPAQLDGYLVPLDASGREVEGSDYFLGTQQVFEASGYGSTVSFKFPVTTEFRNALMMAGSKIQVPADTGRRNFKLKVCAKLKNGVNFYQPSIYTLELAADKCRLSEAPFEVRLDRSITFLPPVGGEFENADASSAGDGRMAQASDNDQLTGCSLASGICRMSVQQRLEGFGLFGRTMYEMSLVLGGLVQPGGQGKFDATFDVKLFGFTVIDLPSPTRNFSLSSPFEVAIPIPIPWDSIAMKLREKFPGGPRWYPGRVAAGVDGMYVSYEFVFPVRYGLLQGLVVVAPTAGVGASPNINYKFTPNTGVSCTSPDGGTCAGQVVQLSGTLRDVTDDCYVRGGALAELRTPEQRALLAGRASSTSIFWLGGQVANRYVSDSCRTTYYPFACQPAHEQGLRWLSNDDDFATASSFGSYTYVADAGVSGYRLPTSISYPPANHGVTLEGFALIGTRRAEETHDALCVLDRSTQGVTQRFALNSNIGASAGLYVAFCTPGRSAGICFEGSMNLIEIKVNPFISYTAQLLSDSANRRAVRSAVSFGLDWSVNLLTGRFDILVKFWDLFEYRYTVVKFDGINQFFDNGKLSGTEQHVIPGKVEFQ